MGSVVKKVIIPALIIGAVTFLVVASGGAAGPALIGAISAGIEAAAITALVSTLSLVSGFLLKPSQDMGSVLSRQQTWLNQAALGKWVFGKTNAPLDLVFEDKGSNRYVTQVLHSASHEINAVLELHINDELAINAAGTLQAPWTNIIRRFENLGTAAQPALVMSNSAWPAAAKGQGLAHIGLEWDFKDGQEKISGGVPTRLTQVIEGCMVYDPRLDTTVGGTGPHRGNDQTTWEYNDGTTDIGENWALLVAFYLLGWQINGKLVIGMGIDPADIDTDQLIDAANVCEQIVDGKKRYKIGGVLQTDGNHQRILKELESAIGGKISKIGGKWFIWAPNDDLTSLETITDGDLVADVPQVFRPAGPLAERYNGARGRFVNPDSQYQPEFYPDVSEASAVTEDGRIYVKEQDFAMIQDVEIAERVARMMVRRSRFAGTFRYVFWFTAIRFQPFDVITINGRDTNDLDVLVRIIDMGISPAGIVVLLLLEEDSSIYNTSDPLGTPLTQQDPDAFDPTAKIPLTGLVATPITLTGDTGTKTDGFDVTWDTVGGLVKETEVQFAVTAVVLWQPVASSSRDFDNAIIAPVETGTNYNIRARHITITGVVGDFVTLTNQLAGSDGTGVLDGLSVFVGNVFKRSASAPATPTVDDGSYNFTTQVLTPPAGWSTTPPAGSNPLYVSTGSFSVIGQTGTDQTVTWTAPDLLVQDGTVGDDGRSVFVANVFKRSASAPATPTVNDGQYDFGTQTLTPPAGWSVSPPAGADPLYVSTGSFSIIGQTGIDTTVTWTSPDLLVQDGADGATGLDGITFVMSNPSHGIPAANDGTVTSGDLVDTGTDIQVKEGATFLTHETGVLSAGEFKIVSRALSPTGFSGGTISGDGTNKATMADIGSWSDTTALTGFVDYTIDIIRIGGGGTETFNIKQSFTIIRAGATGDEGPGGDVVLRAGFVAAASVTPNDATIRWELNSSGSERSKQNADAFANIGTWLINGVNSDYAVFASFVTGDTLNAGALNTWQLLSTTRFWQQKDTTSAGGPKTTTLQIQVRRVSDNTIVTTATLILEAEESA